ncbi:MAG: hypothetical protein NVSMB6_31090 [Burkholderiaceae bacterium]
MHPQHPAPHGHASVIGGSMAGLVTARVLLDHFDQVTIIERDYFPTEPRPRSGVPQSSHIHILLGRGQVILERLFPGLLQDFTASGATILNAGSEIAYFSPAGWHVSHVSPITVPTCTRPLIEGCVRERLLHHPRLQVVQGAEVTGLLATGGVITGVRIRPRPRPEIVADSIPDEMLAELVFDASGRTSRSPQWLAALGYASPTETIINAFLGYATCIVEPPAGVQRAWKALYVLAAPPEDLRAGVIWPVEGECWQVTLAGTGKDYPPTDPDRFLDFARSLRHPAFYEAIAGARRLSPVTGYQATENRMRHYERLQHGPEGFLVTGDAACAFNPVYGQGMTVAAIDAQLLDRVLRRQRQQYPDGSLRGLGRRFQRQLARSNAPIWIMATAQDYRSPVIEGGAANLVTRLSHRYLDVIDRLATTDVRATNTFHEVYHLLKPPSTLYHPRILLLILQSMRKPRQPASP